ncbi:MAG: polysaccharide biosynthesis/export family protein [Archangium sp.]|nr:polysaccharide biosynthesis/export family protein [Archangium sp.]MDP3154943.1 polysaccharide biosynthesis/export family protein [Archangium sp.]MDP3576062.1 polysaccharide biosynthesis/export family protein [Archangium sp.]
MRPLMVLMIAGGLVTGSAACRYPSNLGDLKPNLLLTDAGVSNTLAANDLLEVRVYQEPDLSGVYRVDGDGHIDFPLCGKVQVGGVTASGAAEAITTCLKNGFVRRPQVSALVKEFNSKKVFVFGEVSKPGSFAYEDGMTIIHAISQAGGLTRSAAKNSVNVTRVVDGKEVKLPVKVEDIVIGREKNFQLVPGDIIFVPESFI